MGRDEAGGGTWGKGAKKQERFCKAMSTWVWRRRDGEGGRKGGHMGTQPQVPFHGPHSLDCPT